MANFIKIGKADYKLLYLLFSLIVTIIESFFSNIVVTRGNCIISLLINSLAKIFCIFFFFSIKCCIYKNIKLIEEKRPERNKIQLFLGNKYVIFSISFMSYWLYVIYYGISRSINSKREIKSDKLIYLSHGYGFFYLESFEIFFIFILTKCFFNFEYYIHNKISVVIFCAFSFTVDIINYNNIIYKSGGIICFFLILFIIFFESAIITLQRNLMNHYYISPYLVLLIFGTLEFIFSIILSIISIFSGGLFCEKKDKCFVPSVEDYFKNFTMADVISILTRLIFKMVFSLLNIFIIYYLGPNHMLVKYIMEKFYQNIYEGLHWTSFFIFPFQFLSLLVYLEIIELNFCGINKNTKKSISSRALEDTMDTKDDRIIEEVGDDDDNGKNKNKIRELGSIPFGNYTINLVDEEQEDYLF